MARVRRFLLLPLFCIYRPLPLLSVIVKGRSHKAELLEIVGIVSYYVINIGNYELCRESIATRIEMSVKIKFRFKFFVVNRGIFF